MWTLLGITVPLAIVVFFLARCSNSPLALCSLVIVSTLGPAVYLNTWPISFHIPFLPIAVEWWDISMLMMGVAWAYALVAFRHRRPASLNVGIDTWVLLFLVAFLCLEALLAWESDGRVVPGVAYAMRVWLFLLVSMGMWISILRRATRMEVDRFLDSLAWLMVPLSVMYCLSEVGLATNPYVGWAPVAAGIVRDTLTFPFFAPLALAWFCSRRTQSVWTLGAEGVLLASCALSYSRTIAVGAVVIVIAVAVMRATVTHRFSSVVKGLLVTSAIVGLCGAGLVLLAPEQLGYAVERFGPTVQYGANEVNTATRLSWLHDGAAIVGQNDPLFGLGFGKDGARVLAAYGSRPGTFLWDLTWAVVLFTFGWLGLVVYGGLYAQYVILAILDAARQRAEAFGLASALVGLAVYDLIRTTATFAWGIYPTASALALALLYVNRRSAWAVVPERLSADCLPTRGGEVSASFGGMACEGSESETAGVPASGQEPVAPFFRVDGKTKGGDTGRST